MVLFKNEPFLIFPDTSLISYDELWLGGFSSFAFLLLCRRWYLVVFFFQAEDGIRDVAVTEFRRVLFRSVGGRAAAGRGRSDRPLLRHRAAGAHRRACAPHLARRPLRGHLAVQDLAAAGVDGGRGARPPHAGGWLHHRARRRLAALRRRRPARPGQRRISPG